jgi:hypothetical protein
MTVTKGQHTNVAEPAPCRFDSHRCQHKPHALGADPVDTTIASPLHHSTA